MLGILYKLDYPGMFSKHCYGSSNVVHQCIVVYILVNKAIYMNRNFH